MNTHIAEKLREVAVLLDAQGAEPFRVRAFRRAAETVDGLGEDVGEILSRTGLDGLVRLPGIGKGIAQAIAEMVITGRWARLERLRGELDPLHLFTTVPGIGPALAARIHDVLHIDTLEALETAAHDGRLEQVPGIGARRAAAVRIVLDSWLGRTRGHPMPAGSRNVPAVATLLAVDEEYRERAGRGELPRIAPKRFNPTGERWLPVLHTDRSPWHFTALFSNTARAHELHRTDDWVVIYCYDDDHVEGQCTVVTETRGKLKGERVVRGREAECAAAVPARGRSVHGAS